MTNGAFAALAVALGAIVDPGDEVIFISPPWFFYEALILARRAQSRCGCKIESRHLRSRPGGDRRRRSPRAPARSSSTRRTTRPAASTRRRRWRRWPACCRRTHGRHGRPIYLLSDEAYSRIVFDGHASRRRPAFYPHTFLIYTYGKTLLTPGQRIGYIALPPTMPAGARGAAPGAVRLRSWSPARPSRTRCSSTRCADLEQLSIDVVASSAQARPPGRRRCATFGYERARRRGTFYLLPRSPLADDLAFTELLAEQDVFVLPGTSGRAARLLPHLADRQRRR